MKEKLTPKKKSEIVLSPTELQKLGKTSISERRCRSRKIMLLVALEKSMKDSRDFMPAEFRSNQAKIKNQLNEMQSKLDFITMRFNEVEERVSDIEDKLMAKRETGKKRETIKRS